MSSIQVSAHNYPFNMNNKNIEKKSDISSKLTIKTRKRSQLASLLTSFLNSEQMSCLFLVFLLLNLSK